MTIPSERIRILKDSFDLFSRLRDPARQSWILMNPTSLGDTMVVCALLKAFREKHGGPITMVVAEEQVALAHMYKRYIDRILTVSLEQLQLLSVHLAEGQIFSMDMPFVAHPFWHGDGRWEHFQELFRYPKRGGVGFCDIFRHILHLDWDTPLELPVIPEEWRQEAAAYAAETGMVPGKSVILFPDNNSNPGFPDSFWKLIADECRKNGRKVFTNLAGNRQGPRTEPFEGTSGINIPLRLAIPLVEIAGRYIAGVNGLICALQLAKAQSEATLLIYSKPFKLNAYHAKDPIPHQSLRYLGFSDQLATEYLVDPDQVSPDLIADIVANNPRSALVW
jgi:hypothetical protein